MIPGCPAPTAAAQGSPRHLALAFLAALNQGEAAIAASLFSVHGCFVTPDGTAVTGAAGLRGIFRQMGDLGVQLEIESLGYHQAGDVCLVGGRGSYRTRAGDPGSVEPLVSPRLVLARNRSAWELAIVALWGP